MKLLLVFLALILPLTAIEFDSIHIMPRQDDKNNTNVPKSWTMETSKDGVAWTLLAAGSFDNTTTEKISPGAPTKARFLRFSSLTSHINQLQTCLAEIRVFYQGKEYSNADWKAASNNELPATDKLYGPASFAIDGNDQTCWHTLHLASEMKPFPHTITIDFGEDIKRQGNAIELAWDANPETSVINYVVNYGNSPSTMTQTHGASNAITTTVANLPPGEWFFTVKAMTLNGESEPSTMAHATLQPPTPEPIPVPKPKGLRVVTIETSSNLTDWEPIAYVPLLTDAPARFVRAGLTTISQP